ncbi:MAG: hypothetical protein WDM78_01755 [Puia sp.]
MAHSKNSVITGKLSGILGKELVFRDWEGKTVVATAPKARTTAATAAQGKNTGAIPAGFALRQGGDNRYRSGYS